ncbi:hypothetical protein [Acidisoma sp. L85]|uniref:hypothetical protein n=1 Tax=Acidisoma sp. L85 TaxID=1641850 RepID=UPI00131D027E|nr:hypothetical protein [Acidisoma sp. L85]
MLIRLSVAVYWLSVGAAIAALAIGGSDLSVNGRALMDGWFDALCWVALAAAIYACGWLFRYLFGPQTPSLNVDRDL